MSAMAKARVAGGRGGSRLFLLQQLVMRAAFCNDALAQNNDYVTLLHGGQSMSYNDSCALASMSGDHGIDALLHLRVRVT